MTRKLSIALLAIAAVLAVAVAVMAAAPAGEIEIGKAAGVAAGTKGQVKFTHEKHADLKCVDCHLPNNNLPNHLFWKTVDGVKDSIAFHTGRISETIHLSDHGAQVVETNCRRCHAELVSQIRENRRCWDCHRRISHKSTGTIATLTP